MPVLRYLLWVGGALLALLFVADSNLPRQPPQAWTPHAYKIPIAASVRPGPQPVTFSGETRNFGSPPPMIVVDFSARPDAATQSPTHQAIQARAEMTGTLSSAEQSAKPARQKVAKRKVNRHRELADRDPARLPDGWRQEEHTGLAFARPFFW